MEKAENAGPGTPQGTAFDEYGFVAVDKSLSVDAIFGMCGAGNGMYGNPESYFESIVSLEDAVDSRSFEERFMMEMPEEMRESMLGGYLYAPMSDMEKVAMEAMSATKENAAAMCADLIKEWVTDAEGEIKCASFLAACEPTPFEAAETQDKMLEAALDAMRSALDDHFDRARRLIHNVRRNIALKRFTIRPVAFPLDWLDLVVRRRRRIGATIATVDRLFSLSSRGGWST